MFVIRHRAFFFALSGILVAASLLLIALWGLRPGIDFTGGSIVEVEYAQAVPTLEQVTSSMTASGFSDVSVRASGDKGFIIRTKALAEGDTNKILSALGVNGTYSPNVERISSIGPTVGQELRRKTYIAIFFVVLMIIFYVAFVFRQVSKPLSSWVYGLVAILTLLHDIIIPAGVFALLGHTIGLEADTLFVVALLTILGVSINDTLVVFDRVRENLHLNGERGTKEPFAQIVGRSLEQTYVRSFNTSFTVVLVLLILFFLGGPVIHTFILTLLVGQIAGTYSSIFIASPLLVVFDNLQKKTK